MNAFEHFTRQLIAKHRVGSVNARKITPVEYDLFCKEYVFDNLREVMFGAAFCKKFNITDYVLDVLQSEASAKKHIKTVGYVSDTDGQ